MLSCKSLHSQRVQIKPFISSAIYLGDISFKEEYIPFEKYQPRRVAPTTGLDISYLSNKKWGMSLGVQYNQHMTKLTDYPINNIAPNWNFYDYNLWFPLKMIYELPFNRGERSITFALGSFLGYNKFLLLKTQQYLAIPFGGTQNYPYKLSAGYAPYSDKGKFQLGLTTGVEIQPFKKMNGIMLGLEYQYSFLPVAEKFAMVMDVDQSGNYFAKNYMSVRQTQSYFQLKLLYNLTIKKHTQVTKWHLLNIAPLDSSYYIKPLKPIRRLVPQKYISPYISFEIGLAHHILQKTDSFKKTAYSFIANSLAYSAQIGGNYFFKSGLGLGGGFEFASAQNGVRMDSSYLDNQNGSFYWFKGNYFRYQFHINFAYRKYWQHFHHLEILPSLYLGASQYFVFSYRSHFSNAFSYRMSDNFVPKVSNGASVKLLYHPFKRDVGLKFGVAYQIDFIRLPTQTYTGTLYDTAGEQDSRTAVVNPLGMRFGFTVLYSPLIQLPYKNSLKNIQ